MNLYPFRHNLLQFKCFLTRAADLFVIMETELWPVIIHFFQKSAGPCAADERQASGSRKGISETPLLFGQVMKDISFLHAEWAYADRIISIGAGEENVHATGNFKFDSEAFISCPGLDRDADRTVLIGR